MKELAPSVWAHVVDAEGFPTLAAVVVTERLVFVVDTLTGPSEAAPLADFVTSEAGDRRTVVVKQSSWPDAQNATYLAATLRACLAISAALA